MTYQDQKNFTFVSQAFPEDTFAVVRFKGSESISKLYEFDITLSSNDPDIDGRSVLQNPATFTIVTPDIELPIYGIMSRFEQLQEVDENVFYRGVLVPRFWQSTLSHDNELFLEKNVQGIIEEMMTQAGLTSNDFDIRLTADYPTWEYICQYRESDFAFVSRWMEREGIFYYFEQTDNGDKLIITDSSTSHQDVIGNVTINYVPPSGLAPTDEDAVRTLTCRQQMLPANVVLRDYNYRRPTLDLRGEADVDASGGRGTVYIYGEHFKTPEEGNALARIRAEELLCREQVFYGESTAANLRPGYLFELAGHYRESYNQRYLILDVAHKGRQTRFPEGESESAESDDQGPGYTNQFSAIPADIQFRPERDTPRPRFNGTMNGTVDAAGDGQYAEVDDEGRYKVILPFDQSGNSEGKASRWVRMAQPYSGANFGMHFPLHKGTEVLLTFVDGDPDRPIIAGSVPNPDTMSPVTGGNQTSSVIRTGGGNQIRIEDSDGGQQIHLSSPTQGTVISLGAPNEGNLFFKTDGDYVRKVHGPEKRLTNGKVYVKHGATYKYECTGAAQITYKDNVNSHTVGTTTEKFEGDKTSVTIGNTNETFTGTKVSHSLATTEETFVGAKASQALAATSEIFVGAKQSACAAFELVTNASLKVEKSAARVLNAPSKLEKINAAYDLMCGSYDLNSLGTVTIDASGANKIKGASITVQASGDVLIKGGDVKIQGSDITLDGAVTISKTLQVKGAWIKHGDAKIT
ncbi:MAG: type VI secretion system tip protein VgrG [Desulfobacteraceae bacterium]|nr:type VI secretion system tip protein VgrG [Desulfobacteraceae bacterium]MBC2754354.1 type VI secretion system tip protein VgrG [Desulfobacteraceae bacterium]